MLADASHREVCMTSKPIPPRLRSLLRHASSPRKMSAFNAGGLLKKRKPRAISLAVVKCLQRPDEP